MMQDLSGQKLSQYELREQAGRGGMANVYKAFQPGLERFVAVKVMLGHLVTDAEFVERFRREARAVAQLRHPNIVNVFDFGVEHDIYYMVMEFIKGENLKAYIANNPTGLSLDEALRITSQLADALDYAHKAGMVHRDVKPANILFADDSHQQAILTDFGIAHILSQPGLTTSGAMIGTPAYLSPEIASGNTADERVDIYGLGIILYEMLTGRVPYEADTPMAVIMKHVNAPLPSPTAFGRPLPEEVEGIILKAMMKNPAERYQTAGEMKAAIDSARAHLTKVATPAPAIERTTLGSNAAPNMSPPPVVEQATTQLRKTTSRSPLIWVGLGAAVVVIALLVVFSQPSAAPDEAASMTSTAASNQVAAESTLIASETTQPTANATLTDISATQVASASVADVSPRMAELREAGLLSGLTPLQDEIDTLILDGQADVAREQLNQMLETNPDNVDTLVARSLLLALIADASEAMADADRAVELAPDSPLGYIARSEAFRHWTVADYTAALGAAQQALAIAPENPEALWRASRAEADVDNYETAAELLTQAEAAGASGYPFVEYAANSLYYAEEYTRALPYLKTLYSADTTNSNVMWILAADLIHLDQVDAAYQIVQDFPLVFTESADLSGAAFIAYKAGDYTQAREWADTALALSNETYGATYLLGLISWYADHNLDAALGYFDELEDVDFSDDFLNPAFGHALPMDRGYILMDAGDYEAAVSAFERALETLGQYPYVYEALADAKLALGDVESARDNLTLALENAYDDQAEQQRLLQRIRDLGVADADATAEATEAN